MCVITLGVSQRLHARPSVSDLIFDFSQTLWFLSSCACECVRVCVFVCVCMDCCPAFGALRFSWVYLQKLRSGVTRSSHSDTQVVIKVTSHFHCVGFTAASPPQTQPRSTHTHLHTRTHTPPKARCFWEMLPFTQSRHFRHLSFTLNEVRRLNANFSIFSLPHCSSLVFVSQI